MRRCLPSSLSLLALCAPADDTSGTSEPAPAPAAPATPEPAKAPPELPTIEEHAQTTETPFYVLAGVKSWRKWGAGYRCSRATFEAGVADFMKQPITHDPALRPAKK